MTGDCVIRTGDCIDQMRDMDDDYFHAVVTDPPYNFDKRFGVWDDVGSPDEYQQWCEEWASECLRVLKPGGHLIAFSGSRTEHRLKMGVENAGFEIRDTITWHYGEGFGAGKTVDVTSYMDDDDDDGDWTGFKMGLKPSTEFAVLARKPLNSTIHETVLEHGTGALNIDRTRIPTDEDTSRRPAEVGGTWEGRFGSNMGGDGHPDGRYPSNLCLDPVAAEMLDSSGSQPSRFFYTAKATQRERTINGRVENNHNTVKPLELMEWLVALVTASGQRVLDPFAGTGTTIMACKRLNREGIGIEVSSDHAALARERVQYADELSTKFIDAAPNGSTGQAGLGAFSEGGGH